MRQVAADPHKPTGRQRLSQVLGWLSLALFCGPLPALLGSWLRYDWDSKAPAGLVMVLEASLFLWLIYLAQLVALPIWAFTHRGRPHRSELLVVWLIACSMLLAIPKVAQNHRTGVLRVIARGEPLVEAIRLYAQRNGEYPPDPIVLVPEYLPRLPITGDRLYPGFFYEQLPDGYEVRVMAGEGLSWDKVFYWPAEEYPAEINGNPVERVGRWAYFHE